jgi:hypothetical protein
VSVKPEKNAIAGKNADWGRRRGGTGMGCSRSGSRPVKSSPDYFHSTARTQVLNPKRDAE